MEISINNPPNKNLVEAHNEPLLDIQGNSRSDIATEYEDDLQMTAGKDRVGFVVIRRNAKKGDKSDRY
ncbi:hypothetical protein [Methylomonas fluvii]|uniref:hypothetical protein n=1 Tax=Methylomonas fluvii TaxID=1854564 RepID=UPI001CE17888|nr:hypothetical protein [Methylomonas fluvii]